MALTAKGALLGYRHPLPRGLWSVVCQRHGNTLGNWLTLTQARHHTIPGARVRVKDSLMDSDVNAFRDLRLSVSDLPKCPLPAETLQHQKRRVDQWSPEHHRRPHGSGASWGLQGVRVDSRNPQVGEGRGGGALTLKQRWGRGRGHSCALHVLVVSWPLIPSSQ